jgi:hypothetical protein
MACTSARVAHPIIQITSNHCFNSDLCDFSSVFTTFHSHDITETRNLKNHVTPCSRTVRMFLITTSIVFECKILKTCTNIHSAPYLLQNVHVSAKSGSYMKHVPQTTNKDKKQHCIIQLHGQPGTCDLCTAKEWCSPHSVPGITSKMHFSQHGSVSSQ